MRITNLKDVRAAVWAGIGYLNVHRPGWRRKIDLDRLNLASGEQCVLGEVYGEFDKGLSTLGLDLGTAEALGFLAKKNPDGSRDSLDYDKLTAEWRVAYRAGQRKAARA